MDCEKFSINFHLLESLKILKSNRHCKGGTTKAIFIIKEIASCLAMTKMVFREFLLFFRKKIVVSFLFFFSVFYSSYSFSQNEINPDGENKFYFDNGKVSSEGYMRNGKPDAYWKTFYSTGVLKSEGNRKNFQLDSLWKFYGEDGKIATEITYINGKKEGYTNKYNDKGVLISSENFIADSKQGFSNYYYDTGELKNKITFVDNKEEGPGFEYDKDSIIITLIEYKKGYIVKQEKINRKDKQGFRQGVWKAFYENGNIKTEGRYVNDKKNGYFKEYDAIGNLKSTFKYINGELQEEAEELVALDIQTAYYSNGKIKSSGSYKNGKPEGVHQEYSSKGEIIASKVYADGYLAGEGILDESAVKQGIWKEYYPNGQLRSEGKYENGKRIDEWTFYHLNGKIEQKGKYIKGERPTGLWK